ncbi:MAG TPA: hypothetical protein VII75_03925 [Thermoanaerobaculia bacterium]
MLEPVFWSGIGADKAAAWAAEHGGITLAKQAKGWRETSIEFALGAGGDVRVLQGDSLRIDAHFRDEFHALKVNPNVSSITAINPDTGIAVTLWSR